MLLVDGSSRLRGGEAGAKGGDCEHGALMLQLRYAGYAGDQLRRGELAGDFHAKARDDLGDVFAVGDQRGTGGGTEADAGNPAVGGVEAEVTGKLPSAITAWRVPSIASGADRLR